MRHGACAEAHLPAHGADCSFEERPWPGQTCTCATLPCTCLLQGERNSLQTSLGEARRTAAAAREQHERLLLEHEADAKSREAAVLEAKARELADLREAGLRCGAGGAPPWHAGIWGPAGCMASWPASPQAVRTSVSLLLATASSPVRLCLRERSEVDAKHREQLEAGHARAASLDAEAQALREQKYGLDARLSELSHKLGAAEGSNRWGKRGWRAAGPRRRASGCIGRGWAGWSWVVRI